MHVEHVRQMRDLSKNLRNQIFRMLKNTFLTLFQNLHKCLTLPLDSSRKQHRGRTHSTRISEWCQSESGVSSVSLPLTVLDCRFLEREVLSPEEREDSAALTRASTSVRATTPLAARVLAHSHCNSESMFDQFIALHNFKLSMSNSKMDHSED